MLSKPYCHAVLMLFILFLIALGMTPIRGDVVKQVGMSDIVHRPYPDEGYIEAYNFRHIQKNLRIYITFLVSNIGPGDLNNGISILIFQNNKSEVITAEYSKRSLKAKAGRFGIRSGRSSFKSCGKTCILLTIKLDNLEISLHMNDVQMGPGLSKYDRVLPKVKNGFVSAMVAISTAQSFGTISHNHQTIALNGLAGMEFLQTNVSPHKYANNINLIRSMAVDGIFLGYLEGSDSKKNSAFGRVVLREAGQTVFEDQIIRQTKRRIRKEPLSGMHIPRVLEYQTAKGCTVIEKRNYETGKFGVLSNVSTVLRWILKVFFANPYVMNFNSDVQIKCPQIRIANKIFRGVESAVYLINE